MTVGPMLAVLPADEPDDDGSYSPPREIGIAPLAIVMFAIVLICLAITPLMMAARVAVSPPVMSSTPAAVDEPVVVAIDASGALSIADKAVSDDDLKRRLGDVTGGDARHLVLIRGDRSVRYQRVMDVLGAITAAGYDHVSLIALAPSPKPGS